MTTLWRNQEAFKEKYYKDLPGYYLAGDEGYIDDDGYITIMGRIDDVINTAGHRLSTGSIEEVIGYHEAVAECCVLGVKDELKGEVPVTFVVLKQDVKIDHTTLERELI